MSGVPTAVRLRLAFLWEAAAAAADASPPQPRVAQRLYVRLRALAGAHGLALPDGAAARLCAACLAPRLPGVTCRVRLATRTRRSPAAMRWAAGPRGARGGPVRTQVVATCLVCGAVRRTPGAARPPAAPARRRAGDEFVPLAPAAPPPAPAPAPAPRLLLDARPRKRKKKGPA